MLCAGPSARRCSWWRAAQSHTAPRPRPPYTVAVTVSIARCPDVICDIGASALPRPRPRKSRNLTAIPHTAILASWCVVAQRAILWPWPGVCHSVPLVQATVSTVSVSTQSLIYHISVFFASFCIFNYYLRSKNRRLMGICLLHILGTLSYTVRIQIFDPSLCPCNPSALSFC